MMAQICYRHGATLRLGGLEPALPVKVLRPVSGPRSHWR